MDKKIKKTLKEHVKGLLEGFDVREESINRAVEDVMGHTDTPGLTPQRQSQPPTLWEVNTPEQVAEYLQVESRTVREWLRSGKLQGLKIGKEWRIRAVDLESFIQDGIQQAKGTETPEPATSDSDHQTTGDSPGSL